jgi:epoxyqueuosine reductase
MPPDPDRVVREKARALGFDAVGVARADVGLDLDFGRYLEFARSGMHGEMGYLAENVPARRRLDGEEILPGAKSVICVARSYRRDGARDPELARTIARYARGRDYHSFLRRKLRKLAELVRTLGPSVRARPMVDDVPVLERAWAARAGLGFVGKNGLVIVPGVGSMVLLGEVVTTLELTPDAPMTERCGSCTRCLDACPTGAFVRPFVLDPRRCVSYLTIEHRSAVDEALRDGVGEHLFGCDDCQTVCPFNATTHRVASEAPFLPLEAWSSMELEELLGLDAAAFQSRLEGSPLKRATPEGLARNAALVLGNRREIRAIDALRRAASSHPAPVVREAAAWALGKIEAGGAYT